MKPPEGTRRSLYVPLFVVNGVDDDGEPVRDGITHVVAGGPLPAAAH